MKLVDVEAVAAFAHRYDVLAICDNTFLSPCCFQRPREFGVEIVVHSATNVHQRPLGMWWAVGSLSTARAWRIGLFQNAIGNRTGPQDSFLVLGGIRTLAYARAVQYSYCRISAKSLGGLAATRPT